MFRKRIAAASLIAAATFAGAVTAPLPAFAQVIDLDEEKDKGQVIDLDEEGGGKSAAAEAPPVVAGEPTEGFTAAKRAFDQEKWPEAAQGMFKVVSGETGDDPGNKQLGEFYLAISLYRLKFFQSSFAIFSVIAEQPNHLKFNETLLWLAKLALELPEPADIIARVGKYSDEHLARFDNKEQQELYWQLNQMLGRYKYRQGEFEEAIRFFQKVDKRSPDYVKAQFFSGISYVRLKKSVPAVQAFQRIVKAVDEGGVEGVEDEDRLRDLANLSMARTYYSASIRLDPETNAPTIDSKKLSAAVKYWNVVDESSEYWLDAQFEEAWAYFMAGQYTRALGNIHTINAPYFPKAFYPEADILKAVVYFTNCDYEKATVVVARFNQKTEPVKNELEQVLKKYQGENQEEEFYKFLLKVREGNANLDAKVEPIVSSALSDRQLIKNIDYVNALEEEMKRFKKSPPQFQSSPIGEQVEQALTLARGLAIKQAGRLAQQRYQRYVDEMAEHMRNGEKILIDITAAQRNLLDQAMKEGQVSKAESKIFGVVNPDDEHFIWPFDGEYWRDELGFYRQEVESACGR
jgi:tetratricopeptide (TPR) repeat protein